MSYPSNTPQRKTISWVKLVIALVVILGCIYGGITHPEPGERYVAFGIAAVAIFVLLKFRLWEAGSDGL